MAETQRKYKEVISRLLTTSPLNVDIDVQLNGRPPTMASSEFLTNKEQGDWAEHIVLSAINENSEEFQAVKYGRSDSIAAGDTGFTDFYRAYQDELNSIGKKPDILIFKRTDIEDWDINELDQEQVSKAIAAIEVRSSSFLATKYSTFMEQRNNEAARCCRSLQNQLISEPYRSLLQKKNPELLSLLVQANENTFREIDFRMQSWYSSQELVQLSSLLRELKEHIKVLHKRDYLSITPKIEDIALVNRWIQHFNVPHYYLQVFFDKAYVIPFQQILELIANPENEGSVFFIERDVKNQAKTTVKIDVKTGQEIIRRIDMPDHQSAMKELERGRLLFYVVFKNGRGYLDQEVFLKEVIRD
jgi:type II restriction enzyme